VVLMALFYSTIRLLQSKSGSELTLEPYGDKESLGHLKGEHAACIAIHSVWAAPTLTL